ncbi:MAG: ABC transporter permease [Ardenticatenaceae bacterium]
MIRELNGILALAFRDITKLFRDRARMVSTLVFPFIFIGILGGSLEAGFGSQMGYNLLGFVFTGVYGQTLFQSAAQGIISLIEDRENDFSQEIFVSPISRYSIVFGKVVGEAMVALFQGVAMIILAFVLRIPVTPTQLFGLLIVGVLVSLFGAAFGMLIMPNLQNQRAANQIFPFVFLPQFFLAGVFNPIQNLPWYLDILSRISPMRYAVDLTRNLFYVGSPEYSQVVLDTPFMNITIMSALFILFMIIGTWSFVRNERNR